MVRRLQRILYCLDTVNIFNSFEYTIVQLNKILFKLYFSGHRDFLMGGAWSVTRFSIFFLIKMDGTLDVWDLLIQQDSPILSVKVCSFDYYYLDILFIFLK